MAKSKDSRFTADELTVPGHSIRVARAAGCLMSHLADELGQLFGLDHGARELLQRACMVAAALHDIGKCGKSFQDMLQHGSKNKHPFLHELLSAVLMSGPGPLRDWLAKRLDSLELDLMAMAAAGHHLRTHRDLATPRVLRGEVLYLDHPSLLPLWQHLGRYLGLDTMPLPATWSPSEDDIHDILSDLHEREDEVKSEFAGSRAPVLPVAKAMVICADIIGSARPENQRDMEEWAGEVLNFRLDAGDLQKVIVDRLKDQGRGALAFTDRSRVKIRLPAGEISQILGLAGAELDIEGRPCTLGFPKIFPLIPAPYLKSRLVVIKQPDRSTDFDPEDFALAIRRQLANVPELDQDPERIEIEVGPRRVLRIKGVTIAGHAVVLRGFEAQGSIAVQIQGLGGRRHMGAGVFVPPRKSA